jgi:hypothetical protein
MKESARGGALGSKGGRLRSESKATAEHGSTLQEFAVHLGEEGVGNT